MALAAVCVGYLAIHVLKWWLARRYIARERVRSEVEARSFEPKQWTIVQPILSGDPKLPELLARNLSALGPEVRFLWMLNECDQLAIDIANQVCSRFPSVPDRVRVVLCPAAESNVNPKSYKLQLALADVTTDYFVVLDDDTTITKNALQDASLRLEQSELYTGLPCYERGINLWSDLTCHFVNNNSILTYLPPLAFCPPLSINGMFYVMKTETLKRLGGFQPILYSLCDDYAIHQHFVKHGLRIHQGVAFQNITTSIKSFRIFHQLMHRWMVFGVLLFREQNMGRQMMLGLFLGLPPCLLLVVLSTCWVSWLQFIFTLIVIVMRDCLIAEVQRSVFGKPLSRNWLLSVVAELLQPYFVLLATCYQTIQWRRHRIKVGRGQSFVIIDKMSRAQEHEVAP